MYDHARLGIMIAYDHRSVLDDSWKEDGEHLDWSVTGVLTASSASLSLHLDWSVTGVLTASSASLSLHLDWSVTGVLTASSASLSLHLDWSVTGVLTASSASLSLHLDWSVTGVLTASSASLSLHLCTVQNLNTTRVKSPLHLVTRCDCSQLSPSSCTATHHFRYVTHSTQLQRSFQIFV